MATFNGDTIEVDAVLDDAPDSQSSIQGATSAVQSQGTSTRGLEKHSTKIPAHDDDDTYKEYLDIIKSVIPDDIDILIISDDDDIDEVREFKKDLEKNISYYLYNNPMVPNVEILGDIPGFAPTIMDEAYKRALFIFLFVTENFRRKKFKVLQGHACLKESLNDESKRRIVVPVHTGPKNCRLYEFTLTLNATQSLCYGDGAFIEQVNKLFEQEKNTIANRRLDLEDTRKIFFAENRQRLEKQKASFSDPQSRSRKSSEKNKSRATTDEVKSLGKMEDITMSQGQQIECLQPVQSNANLVSHNSSHALGKTFEQGQQFTTDASHSSQNSPSIQRSALMTHNAQSRGEDQSAEVPQSFFSKDNKDLQLMGVKTARMKRESTQEIPHRDHLLVHDVVCDLETQKDIEPDVSEDRTPGHLATDDLQVDGEQCLSSVSSRQSADGAESHGGDDQHQTVPKELY